MSDYEFRYERKFLVDQLKDYQIKGLLQRHPGMFYEPYPPRYVNNFYLDTPDMAYYQDNVSGSMERRKVRVRWYGELFGHIQKPVLEYKIKRGMVGTKRHYPFPAFHLGPQFSSHQFRGLVRNSDLPEEVKHSLLGLNLVLLNRYYRHYYATRDGRFRATLDTEMTFLRMDALRCTFSHRQVDNRNVIVELKYRVGLDGQANRVSGFFPFRVTKSSKYVQGIERVYF